MYEEDNFRKWLLGTEAPETMVSPTTHLAATDEELTPTQQLADLHQQMGDATFSQLTIGELCNVAKIFFRRPTAISSGVPGKRALVVNIIHHICTPVSQSSGFGVIASPLGIFDPGNDEKLVATTLSPPWRALLDALLSSEKETSQGYDADEEQDTGEETEPIQDTVQVHKVMETSEKVEEATMSLADREIVLIQSKQEPNFSSENLFELVLRRYKEFIAKGHF